MGSYKTHGFTIIETMLFLAISGVLIVAMLAGTGVSIQIQRYRDAVETFKTTLQDQYSELTSVKNERDNTWNCDALGQTTEGGAEVRGQSKCVLLGRYVSVVGEDMVIYSVVGYPATTLSKTGNDVQKLIANYTLNISTVTKEDSKLEWGAQIAWPKTGTESRTPQTPRSIAFLFVRSPDSGQIYTFTSDTVPTTPTPGTLQGMLASGETIPGQAARTICIDSGGAFANADSSIYLYPYATGPSSIETRSNGFLSDPNSISTDKSQQC
jgi:type II secretory pathway pseudopilin PulG